MITAVLESLLSFFISILEACAYLLLAVLVPFCFMLLANFVYRLAKGYKIPKRKVRRTYKYSEKFNPIKLFFWDFPKRLVLDYFNRNPDAFDTYGVHIFAGEQGSGKTIATMHFVKCIMERNPMSKLASNIDLNFQQDTIEDWTNILTLDNGEYGQITLLDEIQNWFSSNESRNFPPDMLTEITQQRKQRKIVVGTSQVFTRVSKPIREQITLLYKPMTIAGCLTIVRVYKVNLTDDGTVNNMKMRRWYAFVHDCNLTSIM